MFADVKWVGFHPPHGSFTLAKIVSETLSDSDMKQYLPWPPWVMRQEIETILSVLCHPRWPMQVNSDCRCHWHYCINLANVNTASDCQADILATADIKSFLVRVNQCNRFPLNICGFPLPARLQWVEPPGGGVGSGNLQTFGRKW